MIRSLKDVTSAQGVFILHIFMLIWGMVWFSGVRALKIKASSNCKSGLYK
jgi:hypothetical protein